MVPFAPFSAAQAASSSPIKASQTSTSTAAFGAPARGSGSGHSISSETHLAASYATASIRIRNELLPMRPHAIERVAPRRTDETGPARQCATVSSCQLSCLLRAARTLGAILDLGGSPGRAVLSSVLSESPTDVREPVAASSAYAIATRLLTDCTQKLF